MLASFCDSWGVLGASWSVLGASWGRLGPSRAVLGASWSAKPSQYKPGLALEREARFYSYAVALYGYMLCVSALANCKNTLAGRAILPHLTDAVCIELRFNLFRFPFFVSRFHLFSVVSLRRYARFTRFARSRASRAKRIKSTKPQLIPSILSTLSSALRALRSLRALGG